MYQSYRHEKHQRSWGQIFLDLFLIFGSNIKQSVHEKQMMAARIVGAIALLVLGSIFLLVGLAVFIGSLINQTVWAGLIAVGIVLALIGLLISKR